MLSSVFMESTKWQWKHKLAFLLTALGLVTSSEEIFMCLIVPRALAPGWVCQIPPGLAIFLNFTISQGIYFLDLFTYLIKVPFNRDIMAADNFALFTCYRDFGKRAKIVLYAICSYSKNCITSTFPLKMVVFPWRLTTAIMINSQEVGRNKMYTHFVCL